MKSFVPVLTALAILTAAVPASAEHGIHGADGVTAKIARGGLGDVILTPWSNGNHVVYVSIFQKDEAGAWSQVQMQATLRVFQWDAAAGEWVDKASVPFTSDASNPKSVAFSADDVGRNALLDVFVTFSELGVNDEGKVPTSHMSAARNHVLDRGLYDQADLMDYHGAGRVVGL